jgi:predicted RNA-binding Zn-ribbon protein involved in translation (DUF1610 family)
MTPDVVYCGGCGRSIATMDGTGMLEAIKGPCPECGARDWRLARAAGELGEAIRSSPAASAAFKR